MGYVTRYEITLIDGHEVDAFNRWLRDERDITVDCHEPVKWYEHKADIASAMLATGAVAVDLHGIGEDQGDVWDKEFRLVGGKVTILTFKYRLVRDKEPT